MLHELVFLGCHSQIASYPPYTFASYSYGCKILQPYVAATMRMRSDAVLSSTGALLMKTLIKIIANNKWSTFASAGFGGRIHVNQPLFCMTVFNRRGPVEDNTASEHIRIVAATYGCKILLLYEYYANVYGYNAKCE